MLTKTNLVLESSPYRIHAELLRPLYYVRSCQTPCGFIGCCTDGVSVSVTEMERILQSEKQILPFLRRESRLDSSRWFTASRGFKIDDSLPHRPAYLHLTTLPHESAVGGFACPFLDDEGLCALHRAGQEIYEEPWKFKPMTCWLYPLFVSNQTVKLARSSDLESGWEVRKHCLKRSAVATLGFRLFESELRYLLGDAAYSELEQRA